MEIVFSARDAELTGATMHACNRSGGETSNHLFENNRKYFEIDAHLE